MPLIGWLSPACVRSAVRRAQSSVVVARQTLCLGLILAGLGSSATAEPTLTWCGYYYWPPLLYRTETGEVEGILADQVALFARRNPEIKVEARVVENWRRCQSDVARGAVDMIVGANYTPNRATQYNYVQEPAFINRSNISAYAAETNNRVQPVTSQDQLRRYRLAMTRGNSFGSEWDPFVQSLEGDEIIAVNDLPQSMMMVTRGRADYVIVPEPMFDSAIREQQERYPNADNPQFKKIFTLRRETPTYVVFSKRGNRFEEFANAWRETIQAYYSSVDLDEEVRRHLRRAEHLTEK